MSNAFTNIRCKVKQAVRNLKKKKVVLFVCTGNTCRSPMAEKVFEDYLAAKGILGEYSVESAGLSVSEKIINPLAKEAILQSKIKCGSHKPRQLDIVSVTDSYRVICMEDMHKELIVRAVGELSHIKTVNEITGKGNIADPYGQKFSVYLETIKKIIDICDDLFVDIIETQTQVEEISVPPAVEKTRKKAKKKTKEETQKEKQDTASQAEVTTKQKAEKPMQKSQKKEVEKLEEKQVESELKPSGTTELEIEKTPLQANGSIESEIAENIEKIENLSEKIEKIDEIEKSDS